MTKLNLVDATINDYLKFESLTEVFGLPVGELTKPGDIRYFLITHNYGDGSVHAKCGLNHIYFDARLIEDDGTYLVRAQFPMTMQDWRLRVTLPKPQELPMRLRISRWFRNLKRISLWHDQPAPVQ